MDMAYPRINYTALMMTLLDFLGRDPENAYHVRELARRTGISVGAVSMTLTALQGSGLVEMERKGGLKLYRFNTFSPVARQFKVLFTVHRVRDLVEALRAESIRVILYGSSAEGTDLKDSDIDLFIETQEPSRVKDTIRRFQRHLDRNLSPIIVNPLEHSRLRREDRSLWENILRGRVLWQRE